VQTWRARNATAGQVRSGKEEVGSARVSTGAGGVMIERLFSNDIIWRRWWNAAAQLAMRSIQISSP
jgi:hypothetical protein